MENYIFGLKSGQDIRNQAAHPHQEFPGVLPGFNFKFPTSIPVTIKENAPGALTTSPDQVIHVHKLINTVVINKEN